MEEKYRFKGKDYNILGFIRLCIVELDENDSAYAGHVFEVGGARYDLRMGVLIIRRSGFFSALIGSLFSTKFFSKEIMVCNIEQIHVEGEEFIEGPLESETRSTEVTKNTIINPKLIMDSIEQKFGKVTPIEGKVVDADFRTLPSNVAIPGDPLLSGVLQA